MENIKKDTLIENLNIHDKTKEILKKAGYNTVEDLASAKMEDVEKHFIGVKGEGIGSYDGSHAFRHLRALIHHDYQVTFAGEYEHLGLAPEIATIPTTSLDLPIILKNVLIRKLMAYTLGDILTIDYETLLKTKNIGEYYLKILKDYVHGLGYTLKDEEPTLNEILAFLKEKGVKLLEETIDDAKVYMPLYRNGIYSIEDLLNFGPDVYKIVGFGHLKQQALVEKMKELNLTFNVAGQPAESIDIPRPMVAVRPTDVIVEQAKKENDTIRARINRKEALVTEYDQLMEERKKLIAREQELDQLIQLKVSDMKEGIPHGRK